MKKKSKEEEEEEEKDFRRKAAFADSEPDAAMGDLVSHRFLYEGERERIAKRERELRRQEWREMKAKEEKSFPKDIKQTLTSQLRSIACAPRIEPTPFDLWQMPKFKSNAKPRLDTFRRKPRVSSSQAGDVSPSGGVEGNAGSTRSEGEGAFPVSQDVDGEIDALVAEAVAGPDQ